MLAMKTVMKPSAGDVLQDIHYHPVISIVLPFDAKMILKSRLIKLLDATTGKVEEELLEKYPGDIALVMIEKLRTVMAGLNFNTHKKSIAIYLSPVFEKTFYLDITVEEKISIDRSFEIRDLVYHKKQEHQFLVMLITNKESRIYVGNDGSLIRIVTTTPKPLEYHFKKTDIATTNDSKKIALQQFLHHADNTLAIILKAYPLPLFISGTEDLLAHFKNITRFQHSVTSYVHQNVADVSVQEIKKMIAPCIADWETVKQKYLLNRLQHASETKNLAVGIKEVWREAMHRKGSLLLVEKSYQYPEQQNTGDEILFNVIDPYNKFSYIQNAVDDIIEKVFENGGDVEFTDDGLLENYQHIALLQEDTTNS